MMTRASEPPMNLLRSRFKALLPFLGIAPPFTKLVLFVIFAPEFGFSDYLINVMLHEIRVNHKNARLH
jgi:hypothetical protein